MAMLFPSPGTPTPLAVWRIVVPGSNMTQILPYPLWLDHAGGMDAVREYLSAGIRAVVEAEVEVAVSPLPRDLLYCRFPIVDGVGNDPDVLYLAVHTLAALVRMGVPTLVRCGAGVSRSPALAAVALASAFEESPEKCLQRIADERRCDISPGFWKEVVGVLGMVR